MRQIAHLAIVAVLACADAATAPPSDPPVVPTEPGEPAIMQVVAGQAQTGVVARELAEPIGVRLLDVDSLPIANQLVNFVVTAGGGSVFAGAALTNDSGLALERWTLGTEAGTQRVEARAVDQQTGQPIVFAGISATALPDRATTLDVELSDTTTFVGDTVNAMQLGGYDAADQYGNAITGATLTLTVTGWQSSGYLWWSDVEARGLVRVTLDAAADSIRLLAVRDLRDAAWEADYRCFSEGPFVRNNTNMMVDSAFVALASDSVTYDGMRARIWFSGTVERYWENGDHEVEAATRSQWLTQAPDSLRYEPGGWGTRVSAGRYEGGNWCGTGPLVTFEPVVLVER